MEDRERRWQYALELAVVLLSVTLLAIAMLGPIHR